MCGLAATQHRHTWKLLSSLAHPRRRCGVAQVSRSAASSERSSKWSAWHTTPATTPAEPIGSSTYSIGSGPWVSGHRSEAAEEADVAVLRPLGIARSHGDAGKKRGLLCKILNGSVRWQRYVDYRTIQRMPWREWPTPDERCGVLKAIVVYKGADSRAGDESAESVALAMPRSSKPSGLVVRGRYPRILSSSLRDGVQSPRPSPPLAMNVRIPARETTPAVESARYHRLAPPGMQPLAGAWRLAPREPYAGLSATKEQDGRLAACYCARQTGVEGEYGHPRHCDSKPRDLPRNCRSRRKAYCIPGTKPRAGDYILKDLLAIGRGLRDLDHKTTLRLLPVLESQRRQRHLLDVDLAIGKFAQRRPRLLLLRPLVAISGLSHSREKRGDRQRSALGRPGAQIGGRDKSAPLRAWALSPMPGMVEDIARATINSARLPSSHNGVQSVTAHHLAPGSRRTEFTLTPRKPVHSNWDMRAVS
ncbi:hypothetical protein AURDEDRAFT_126041 [Auricularia subglabra TFB-10046 SS5]|nr:hypothetical protein AURDEDRAFT_126041 [Auricularia subglabra TFB-10046 SS5]